MNLDLLILTFADKSAKIHSYADMVKLADTTDSKSVIFTDVWVRVPLSALLTSCKASMAAGGFYFVFFVSLRLNVLGAVAKEPYISTAPL